MDQPEDDFRRHALACPRGRPASGRRLDVYVDYGAFPVWTTGTWPAREGHPAREGIGMASAHHLGISPELAAGLQDWADWHDTHSEYGGGRRATAEQHQAWDERGRVLADRLAAETGTEVVYRWPSGGAAVDCPDCGDRARRRT